MPSESVNSLRDETVKVFVRRRRSLFLLAKSIVGDVATAEDVVQEAFVNYTRVSREIKIDRPESYIFVSVRNLAKDHLRGRVREEAILLASTSRNGAELSASSEIDPERIVGARQDLERFEMAVAELPIETRRALRLYLFDGLTLREVATKLSISIGKTHGIIKIGLEHCERRVFDDPR